MSFGREPAAFVPEQRAHARMLQGANVCVSVGEIFDSRDKNVVLVYQTP